MICTMGSKGGWKALVDCESCLEGLEVREQSARLVCSRKGLAGLSWSTVVILVLDEGDGDEHVGNLGISLGLLGKMFRPLRESSGDKTGVCRGLSPPSSPKPLLLGLGLGEVSVRSFLCNLGLS